MSLVPLIALAGLAVAATAAPGHSTVAQLMERAAHEGSPSQSDEGEVPLGIPNHSPARALSVYGPDAADGAGRSCLVVFTRQAPDAPAALVWTRYEEKGGRSDGLFFRLSLDGTLLRLHRARARWQDGRPLEQKQEDLDPASAPARSLFERERKFWLDGAGRKKRR